MIYNKEHINPDLMKSINKDFIKQKSIYTIASDYSLTYNEVLAILNESGIDIKKLKKVLCQYNLGNEPFIII